MYTRIYILRFPKDASGQPIVSRMVRKYDVEFNILKADISPQQDGMMIVELRGDKVSVKAGLDFMLEIGVMSERLSTSISRDEKKCFHCGACTGICPVSALSIQRPEMSVMFEPDKCTGCGQCVAICPVKAMQVALGRENMVLAA